MAPHRTGRERIEPEADVAGGGIDAVALDMFRDMDRGHPRLRTDLQVDADAGVEMNVLQDPCDRIGRWFQPETMGAIAAGEHQREPGRAVLEIGQCLRIRRHGIGMIDPLHDLPG